MTGSCLVQLAAYATGCIHYLSVICLLGTVTYYDVICHPYIALSVAFRTVAFHGTPHDSGTVE